MVANMKSGSVMLTDNNLFLDWPPKPGALAFIARPADAPSVSLTLRRSHTHTLTQTQRSRTAGSVSLTRSQIRAHRFASVCASLCVHCRAQQRSFSENSVHGVCFTSANLSGAGGTCPYCLRAASPLVTSGSNRGGQSVLTAHDTICCANQTGERNTAAGFWRSASGRANRAVAHRPLAALCVCE